MNRIINGQAVSVHSAKLSMFNAWTSTDIIDLVAGKDREKLLAYITKEQAAATKLIRGAEMYVKELTELEGLIKEEMGNDD